MNLMLRDSKVLSSAWDVCRKLLLCVCYGFFLAFTVVFFVLPASAATFTWDGSAGNGQWATSSNWTPATVPDGNNHDVILNSTGGGGTITLTSSGDSDGNRRVNEMTVSDTDYTLNLSNTKLKMATNSSNPAASITVNNATLTINGGAAASSTEMLIMDDGLSGRTLTFDGNGTLDLNVGMRSPATFNLLIFDGTGTVKLRQANSISAPIRVNSGTLELYNGFSLGLSNATIDVRGGTFKPIGGDIDLIAHFAGPSGGVQGDYTVDGDYRLTVDDVELNSNSSVTVTANAAHTIDDTISGSFSFAKNGAGSLRLDGDNTFTGGLTLNAGTLQMSHDQAPGTGTFTINGGTIEALTGSRDHDNTIAIGGGYTIGGSNNVTFSNTGTVSISSPFSIDITDSGVTHIFDGAWSAGANSFTYNGVGTLRLNKSSSITGSFSVLDGTLQAGADNIAGTGTFIVNGSSGTPTLQAFGDDRAISNANATFISDLTVTGSQQLTITSAVTLDNGNVTITVDPSATLALTGQMLEDETAALIKSGTGTMILDGNKTFTGGLQINAGTVRLDGSTSDGSGSLTGAGTSSQATLLVNTSGVTTTGITVNGSGNNGLRIEGTSANVDSVATDARLSGVSGSGGALTIAYTNAGNRTLGSASSPSSSSSVSLGLETNGGTITLGVASGDVDNWNGIIIRGSNTTVALGADNAVESGMNLTMLAGALSTGGNDQTFGTLTLSGDATIDFASGNAVIDFADSSGVTWGSSLVITNWDSNGAGTGSDQISFANKGLTSGQLSDITFLNPIVDGQQLTGSFPAQFYEFGNTLTPIPEPSSIIAGGAMALLTLLRGFRRYLRKQSSE